MDRRQAVVQVSEWRWQRAQPQSDDDGKRSLGACRHSSSYRVERAVASATIRIVSPETYVRSSLLKVSTSVRVPCLVVSNWARRRRLSSSARRRRSAVCGPFEESMMWAVRRAARRPIVSGAMRSPLCQIRIHLSSGDVIAPPSPSGPA